MKILALIDDLFIADNLRKIIYGKFAGEIELDCRFSYNLNHKKTENYKPINIKNETDRIISNYDLIFSLCSQIFPKKLVKNVRCINFHFGILPGACGVAPITFSIINKKSAGITVHLMDEQIDNGGIIYSREIKLNDYDTSADAELKCQAALVNILNEHMSDLIYEKYSVVNPSGTRHYYSLEDLNKISFIDLNKPTTAGELIDVFRALTFKSGGGAYFISENGEKINMEIKFSKSKN